MSDMKKSKIMKMRDGKTAKTKAKKGAKLSCKFKEALLALFNRTDSDGEESLAPIIQCRFLILIVIGISQI